MRYKFELSIGYQSCRTVVFDVLENLPYTAEEWDALGDDEKDDILYQAAEEWAKDHIDIGVSPVN